MGHYVTWQHSILVVLLSAGALVKRLDGKLKDWATFILGEKKVGGTKN